MQQPGYPQHPSPNVKQEAGYDAYGRPIAPQAQAQAQGVQAQHMQQQMQGGRFNYMQAQQNVAQMQQSPQSQPSPQPQQASPTQHQSPHTPSEQMLYVYREEIRRETLIGIVALKPEHTVGELRHIIRTRLGQRAAFGLYHNNILLGPRVSRKPVSSIFDFTQPNVAVVKEKHGSLSSLDTEAYENDDVMDARDESSGPVVKYQAYHPQSQSPQVPQHQQPQQQHAQMAPPAGYTSGQASYNAAEYSQKPPLMPSLPSTVKKEQQNRAAAQQGSGPRGDQNSPGFYNQYAADPEYFPNVDNGANQQPLDRVPYTHAQHQQAAHQVPHTLDTKTPSNSPQFALPQQQQMPITAYNGQQGAAAYGPEGPPYATDPQRQAAYGQSPAEFGNPYLPRGPMQTPAPGSYQPQGVAQQNQYPPQTPPMHSQQQQQMQGRAQASGGPCQWCYRPLDGPPQDPLCRSCRQRADAAQAQAQAQAQAAAQANAPYNMLSGGPGPYPSQNGYPGYEGDTAMIHQRNAGQPFANNLEQGVYMPSSAGANAQQPAQPASAFPPQGRMQQPQLAGPEGIIPYQGIADPRYAGYPNGPDPRVSASGTFAPQYGMGGSPAHQMRQGGPYGGPDAIQGAGMGVYPDQYGGYASQQQQQSPQMPQRSSYQQGPPQSASPQMQQAHLQMQQQQQQQMRYGSPGAMASAFGPGVGAPAGYGAPSDGAPSTLPPSAGASKRPAPLPRPTQAELERSAAMLKHDMPLTEKARLQQIIHGHANKLSDKQKAAFVDYYVEEQYRPLVHGYLQDFANGLVGPGGPTPVQFLPRPPPSAQNYQNTLSVSEPSSADNSPRQPAGVRMAALDGQSPHSGGVSPLDSYDTPETDNSFAEEMTLGSARGYGGQGGGGGEARRSRSRPDLKLQLKHTKSSTSLDSQGQENQPGSRTPKRSGGDAGITSAPPGSESPKRMRGSAGRSIAAIPAQSLGAPHPGVHNTPPTSASLLDAQAAYQMQGAYHQYSQQQVPQRMEMESSSQVQHPMDTLPTNLGLVGTLDNSTGTTAGGDDQLADALMQFAELPVGPIGLLPPFSTSSMYDDQS